MNTYWEVIDGYGEIVCSTRTEDDARIIAYDFNKKANCYAYAAQPQGGWVD